MEKVCVMLPLIKIRKWKTGEDFFMNGMNHIRKQNYQTLDLTYTALGAVLIVLCSWISIPAAVPFTMQTFAVFFVLAALGGARGTASIFVYILLGTVGLPVFSGFTGGAGRLLGNTGGYIVGFLFTGLAYWLLTRLFGKTRVVQLLALAAGLLAVYAFGTAWFLFVYARTSGSAGLAAVLGWCVFPFLVPDLLKLALALYLARRLSPLLSLTRR